MSWCDITACLSWCDRSINRSIDRSFDRSIVRSIDRSREVLDHALALADRSLKKALRYLVEQSFLADTPRDVAAFLRLHGHTHAATFSPAKVRVDGRTVLGRTTDRQHAATFSPAKVWTDGVGTDSGIDNTRTVVFRVRSGRGMRDACQDSQVVVVPHGSIDRSIDRSISSFLNATTRTRHDGPGPGRPRPPRPPSSATCSARATLRTTTRCARTGAAR